MIDMFLCSASTFDPMYTPVLEDTPHSASRGKLHQFGLAIQAYISHLENGQMLSCMTLGGFFNDSAIPNFLSFVHLFTCGRICDQGLQLSCCDVLSSNGLYRAVMGCNGLFWAVLGCIGLYRAEISSALQGCTGLC